MKRAPVDPVNLIVKPIALPIILLVGKLFEGACPPGELCNFHGNYVLS